MESLPKVTTYYELSAYDYFLESVRDAVSINKIFKGKRTPIQDQIKKIINFVSTIFLIGFIYHAGTAIYQRLREEQKWRITTSKKGVEKHNIERSQDLLRLGKGSYGIIQRSAGTVLAVKISERTNYKDISVQISENPKTGMVQLRNRSGYAMGSATLAGELYRSIVFSSEAEIAEYLTYQTVFWEGVDFQKQSIRYGGSAGYFQRVGVLETRQQELPTSSLLAAKVNDFVIMWPDQGNPTGTILQKTSDGSYILGESTSSTDIKYIERKIFNIQQIKALNQKMPGTILQPFIHLWEKKLAELSSP